MKNATRALAILLSLLMMVTCFAGMTFSVADDTDAQPESEVSLTNVALGAKVTATSSYIPPEGFFHQDYLTDGQWGTFTAVGDKLGWNTDTTAAPKMGETDPVDVTIELDGVYAVSEAVLKPMQWANGENFPRDFELQVSLDGTHWTTVSGETDADAAADSNTTVVPREYTFDTVNAKYFRIHITRHRAVDAGGAYFSSIGEVEVYGERASYVTDGLVAYFDGKQGDGDKWVDRVNGYVLPVAVDDKNGFNAEGYRSNGQKNYFPQEIVDVVNGEEFTVELLFSDFVSIGNDFNTFLNSDNDNFALFRRNSNNVLEFKFYGCPGGERWTVPDGLNLLQNSLITVTFKAGDTTKCYINGQKVAEKAAKKTMGADNLFIGQMTNKQYDTTYKSMRFYNRVLTAAEIEANALVDGYVYYDEVMVQPDPTYVIDFTQYTKDAAAEFGIASPNGVAFDSVLDSGYITFSDLNGDPYLYLDGAKGLYELPTKYVQYVVYKYRSFGGSSAEFFVHRADGVAPAAPIEKSHVSFDLIADANWHTVVVDASEVWGKDDTKLTRFRLDPVCAASGTQIDVAYIAFFSNLKAAEAYAAADTQTVHSKVEYTENDPAVLPISGYQWGADTWFELKEEKTPLEDNSKETTVEAIPVQAMSPDTFYINGVTMQDGNAQDYIANTLGGVIDNSDYSMDSIAFRGWAIPAGAGEIEAFGYSLNDGEIVWDGEIVYDEIIIPILNSEVVRRYVITIPTTASALASGVYNVYLFVKTTEGSVEMLFNWGSFRLMQGYSSVLKDADGNTYTLNGQRVCDEEGIDTGLIAWNCDDGRLVAASAVYQLTYQDPADGAVAVGEKKYIYDDKIAVTEKVIIHDPADNSALTEIDAGTVGSMSPDTYIVNGGYVQNGGAADWIAKNLGGIIRNNDYAKETVGFFGWAIASEGEIEAFGYSLNNNEVVWDGAVIVDENVAGILCNEAVRRYRITIDTTPEGLADGVYNVYLYLKTTDGKVELLNVWGDMRIIQGGTAELVGYEDAKGNVYPLDSVIYTEDGNLFVLTNALDVTDGIPEESGLKGKYVAETVTVTAKTPKKPVNPAYCQPVYILDGEGLNTSSPARMEEAVYDYSKGCIRYTATGNDPNAGSHQIPAGTVVARYMVFKYRTTCSGAIGEVFTGVGNGASGGSRAPFPNGYVADGEWHYFVIDIAVSGNYDTETNVINHFRNDCVQSEGQWVEIEYYAFFDNAEYAEYYASHDMHVLPQPPKSHVATFVADGEVVGTVEFTEGDKALTGIPKVPVKDGYTGKWEKYTLADADITINAVYTAKPGTETEAETEQATEPVDETEPATEPVAETEPVTAPSVETEPATEPAATVADATEADATEAETAPAGGCKSAMAVSGLLALLAVLGAAVLGKKRED